MSNFIKPIVFCEGCLSTERQLWSIEEFLNIYTKILGDHVKISKAPLLCWECKAFLRTAQKFQDKVKQANLYLNERLRTFKKQIICLSNLSISNTSDIVYIIHDEFNETELKSLKEEDSKEKFDNANENFHFDVPIENDNENKNDTSDDFEYEYEFNDNVDNYNDNVNGNAVKTEKSELDFEIKNIEVKLVKDPILDKYVRGDVRQRKRRNSFTNERFIVKEYSAEEMKELKRRGKRVYMDEKEMLQWREKMKLMRNYRVRKFRCETCLSGFVSQEKLDVHVKKKHLSTIKKYECDICKQKVDRHNLSYHVNTHFTKYVCSLCDQEFHPMTHFVQHLNSAHKSTVECIKCKMQFTRRSHCNKHYLQAHVKVVCNECGRRYTSKKLLIRHIRSGHTEHKCPTCLKTYSSLDSMKRHQLAMHIRVEDQPYCVECDMSFNNAFLYDRHLKTSTKHRQRRYPCSECGKVYHKRTTLNNHYNLVHLQKTKHYCELCDRYFLTGYRLRVHKANTHDRIPKLKTKVCHVCSRAFHTNRILQNHMRTHTGERPFHCEYCTSTFAQKSALTTHTKAIHKVS